MAKLSISRKIDNAANPVLIKDVRQSIRELVFALAVLTAALTVLSAVIVATGNSGTRLFRILSFALTAVLGLAALAGGSRFAAERSGGDDLLFLTTLSPWRIVLGKFAAAMAFAAVLWFAFFPFFIAAWTLQGVNLSALAAGMFQPLLWLPPFTAMIMIFAAVKAHNAGGKMTIPTIILAMSLFGVAALPPSVTVNSWISQATAAALLTVVELSLAQAALLPPNGNRMPWPRFWGLISVSMLAIAAPWMTSTVPAAAAVIAALLSLIGCCEPLAAPRRALAETPHRPLWRIFHFLFASGAASAWTYSLLLAALVWCAGNLDFSWSMRYTGLFFYAVFYVTLCWIIRRTLPGNGLAARHPALVPALVFGVMAAVSAAAMQFIADTPGVWLFFSPLELAYNAECVWIGFVSSLTMMTVAVLYSLPRAVADARKFRK